MSESKVSNSDTLAGFLAYAHILECETDTDLRDMAEGLVAHNNEEAARLLGRFVEWCDRLISEIDHQSQGKEMPRVPPWDFPWTEKINLHLRCMEKSHYMMVEREVLELVLPCWRGMEQYYAEVAEMQTLPEIRALAKRYSGIKREEVGQLESWLAEAIERQEEIPDDLDEPHIPE